MRRRVSQQGAALEHFPFDLGDVVVFLAAAGLVAPFLHRLGVSPVLTFLVAGVVVGPHGLGLLAQRFPWIEAVAITNTGPAEALAEIGVVLLLFLIGLELSLPRLWGMRRQVAGLGGVEVVAATGLIALAAGLLGAEPAQAFVIGAALAHSSTAIVLQLLTERRQLGGATGQAALATLLAQDLAVVPMLIMVGILGMGEEPEGVAVSLARAGLTAVAAIALIIVAGRKLAQPFLRAVAGRRSAEMFVAAVLLLIVVTSAATLSAGLSIALGAFLAGLLLSETEYRHQIDVMLDPFKGLLLGLFFLSVGMRLDLARALAEPLPLLGALAGLLAIKAGIVVAAARALRIGWPAALESAMLLAAGGEFAFVVLAAAQGQDVLTPEQAGFAGLVAGLSMVVTPLAAGPARRLARSIERHARADAHPPAAGLADLSGHVLIAGYGRVGRMLGEVLSQEGVPIVAVDRNAEEVARLRARGETVYFGDAGSLGILSRLAAERAAALVVTMDEPRAVEAVVRLARRAWPELRIFARARDSAHAARLAALGAERVTPEALEASLDLAQAVLAGVGVGEDAARSIVEARRRQELEGIRRRAE